ncbi:MAG TPA: M28 family peptidase [Pyrinomonadaceae bacterium]
MVCFLLGVGAAQRRTQTPRRGTAVERQSPSQRGARPTRGARLSPPLLAALERISAGSLRAHLSFLASDALEGRATPSRGLDVAAEYIASQFRRAGLEAVGDDGYFQTANWQTRERSLEGFEMRLSVPDAPEVGVERSEVSLSYEMMGQTLWSVENALSLERAPVVKVDFQDAAALAALTESQLGGRVVVTELPDFQRVERSRWQETYRAQNAFLARLMALKAALVVAVNRNEAKGRGTGSQRLIDPERQTAQSGAAATRPAVVGVHSPAAVRLYDALKAGETNATVSLRVPAQSEKQVKVRNVVGLLRGSDPALEGTYVILSAHYDHIGTLPEGTPGDRVFNGANDDASGTVTVVEVASTLSALKPRPKRSILFVTFFGEEKGLLGSRFYGRHPVVPIEQTVAQVNLEQVGRTDDSEGAQISTASVTGFDYSDVGEILRAAGEATGVRVYKHPQNSDAFFGRSDNQSLADQGVPAHTLGVAFEFPDYHALGDEWQKIDYANMEKIARTVALGLINIANNPQAPRWNEANPKTERYRKARMK